MREILHSFLVPFIFILLWSSGYVFVESGLRDNTPLIFLSLRFIFSWFIFLIIILIKKPLFVLRIQSIIEMGITGIFLQGIYLGSFFMALNRHVPTGVLAIVLGFQPLLIVLMTRERMHSIQKFGLVLGIIGLFMTVGGNIFAKNISLTGMIFSVLSLLGITIGTILQKKYCSKFPLAVNMFVQYCFGAIFISFICLLYENSQINWTMNFIISLGWVVIVISVLTFFLFYVLLEKGKAGKVTSLLYCVPPVTAAMDYFIFKHTVSTITIYGMICVMLSIIFIHKKKSDKLFTPFKSVS